MRASCFLLHSLLILFHTFVVATRVPYEFSCFLALMRFHEISEWVFMLLISCFLAVMRFPCAIRCFLLHNFRMRYRDENSCLFGPLRALRMRLHACLGRYEMSWWCDVRTVERWVLMDAGDWVLRTRWFLGRCVVLCVQVGWFVGGGNECKFCGGGRWKCECVGIQKGLCGSCLIRVSPACMTSSRYVRLRIT